MEQEEKDLVIIEQEEKDLVIMEQEEKDLVIMEQEEKDLALEARKAELLSVFDEGIRAVEEQSIQVNIKDSVQELENSSDASRTRDNPTLHNGQQKDNDTPMKVDSGAREGDMTPETVSLSDSATNSNGPVNSDIEYMNGTNGFTAMDYNFSTPIMAINFEGNFKMQEDNFTKGCKWAPDGSCLLVASEDKYLRLFNLPNRVASGDIQDENWFLDEAPKHTKPALTMKEGENIYDYTWYPAMNSIDPESCCFAVTCRDFPVHLWDAWHGNLICNYQSYDHVDQLVAANSVTFNLDGSELFCGFNKCIRVFKTSRPGRQFEKIEAKDQPGIISCIAFNPVLPSIFVAGSYLGNLGLYSTDRNCLFCRLDGCHGGITHIRFSSDGTKLFSGARMNNEILCWDLRNPGKMLWSLQRVVNTNQRIYFDLEPQSNRYVVSGATNGKVLKWDLQNLSESTDSQNPTIVKPSSSFAAHNDCCNGVSLNPLYPVLATSSGQRHFPEPVSVSDTESSEDDEQPKFLFRKRTQENSVKLWWLGKQ